MREEYTEVVDGKLILRSKLIASRNKPNVLGEWTMSGSEYSKIMGTTEENFNTSFMSNGELITIGHKFF